MKYFSQILIIFFISALGEILNALIPLPIPASIYAMVLLAAGLFTGLIKLNQVKTVGSNLVGLLPVLFVVPAVSLLDCWDVLQKNLPAFLLITVLSTLLCFAVTGLVTQKLLGKEEDHG